MSDFKSSADNTAGSAEAVQSALQDFIAAFERGDAVALRASFAADAVSFPRSIMGGRRQEPIDAQAYRRTEGMDPQMLAVIEARRGDTNGPPYLALEPRDLDIRVYGTAALATFHVCDGPSLGRRTFVLADIGGEWKIVHMHASNVVSDE